MFRSIWKASSINSNTSRSFSNRRNSFHAFIASSASENSCRNPFSGKQSSSKPDTYTRNPVFRRSLATESSRESLAYDVVIVGAGPAGLSAAIRLKQLCQEKNKELSVCVVEKGAYVGAHIISGNVFEPRALDELLPQWRQQGAPISVPVSSDKFYFLSKTRAITLPSPFNNHGNYVISLSELVRWMEQKLKGWVLRFILGLLLVRFCMMKTTRLLVLPPTTWVWQKMGPRRTLSNKVWNLKDI